MLEAVLNPIAFSLGSIKVHWYGIILGTAALAGLFLAIREGKRFGIAPEFFMDLLLFGVPSAIVGARLYYVAFRWDDYKDNPLDMFKVWEGGIAIYGALIGAIICAVIYVRKRGYNFWHIADIAAPSLLAGQLIGRWGNFINQEAYGGPVKESFLRDSLHLPGFIVNQMNIDGIFYHPTFLYESLWNLLGIVLLFVIRRQSFVRVGELFMGYFIWYSIGRFYIEGLRTDSLAFDGPQWMVSLMDVLWSPLSGLDAGHMAYGNVRSSQLVAILMIIAAVVLIIVRRKRGLADQRYIDPIQRTGDYAVTTGAPADAAVSAGTPASEKSGQALSETKEPNEDDDHNSTV